jgi:hypothetical protein
MDHKVVELMRERRPRCQKVLHASGSSISVQQSWCNFTDTRKAKRPIPQLLIILITRLHLLRITIGDAVSSFDDMAIMSFRKCLKVNSASEL